MTDEQSQTCGMNFGECCGFTQLFRAFRLAVNPVSLLLLLKALVLTYVLGVALDLAWPEDHRPYQGESIVFPGELPPLVAAGADSAIIPGAPTGVFEELMNTLRTFGGRAMAAAVQGHVFPHGADVAAGLSAPRNPLDDAGYGVLGSLSQMGLALVWFVTEHWVFALIFLVVGLAIWAWLGGAVCRIAAVQAARDEKISLREALTFGKQKFLSFYTAPLIPVGLSLFIGAFMIGGGLVGAIPWVGEILAGLFFALALLGGFLIALTIIGAVGGGAMMWPTIAIEGSDAFDAISRGYSYVFAQPWRAVFYAAITLVYGSVCYLFLRMLVWLLLIATHVFVSVGMYPDRTVDGQVVSKLDAMWARPSFASLMPESPALDSIHVDSADPDDEDAVLPAGSGAEYVGGVLIHLFVWLTVGTLYAFLISFFFSGSTLIYSLLRREVDATDLEDVYIEEAEDDAPDAPAATEAEPASTTSPVLDDATEGDAADTSEADKGSEASDEPESPTDSSESSGGKDSG